MEMIAGSKLAASIHWLGLGPRKLAAGSYVKHRRSGETLYFVGQDAKGRRVFHRRNGQIHVSSMLPLDAFEDLPDFKGWDDGALRADDTPYSSSTALLLDDGGDGFDNTSDFFDGGGGGDDDEEEEEEAIWGIRPKFGHQHTLQVICGTPAQVELDYPVASGWEIERLSP